MTQRLTKIVVLATTAALVLYNIGVLVEPTPNDSISAIIHGWAERWSFVPWLVGVLGGHWFWPYKPLLPQPWRYVALLDLFLLFIVVNVIYGITVLPLTALFVGVLCGGMLWGLDDA